MEFKEKVAIVTGAARGIGETTAWAFAKRGATSVIVSKKEEVDAMVEKVFDEFGRIDVLVNNAYISGGYSIVTETSQETWDQVIAVNLTGSFNCAKAVAKKMIPQKSGKIVNISSGAGVNGSLSSGVQYPASKAGIIGLTLGLAGDLAPFGINVNCITPGLIRTWKPEEMAEQATGWTLEKVKRYIEVEVPLKRVGEPEDIAETVVFLSSDAASYIVGEVINVDGGGMIDSVAKRESLLGF
ncbi:MAG: SDR family NAD(P)-dependent oxidoreductase [Candidatus Thorarchaeota archaeon]|jgi:3-oxoacyl-[acyl-carrier protein] reductase